MKDNFVPECYFDTILVKTILKAERVNHKKGCANVVKEIGAGKLKDDFAVGIIDRDKKEHNYIKNECEEKIKVDNLILYKHRTKQHYFIQLAPAIEKWILCVADEGEIKVADFGLSKDLDKLKKRTKSELIGEDEEMKKFCKKLVNSEGRTIGTLKKWLEYLYKQNRSADIEQLKEL